MPYLIMKVGIHHCVGLHVELQHGPRWLRHTSSQPLPHVADAIGRSVHLRRLLLLALQHSLQDLVTSSYTPCGFPAWAMLAPAHEPPAIAACG